MNLWLFFFDNPDRWTLVGTNAVATKANGNISKIHILDIAGSEIVNGENAAITPCEWLIVKSQAGDQVKLWATAGQEFVGLASLILMLERICQKHG